MNRADRKRWQAARTFADLGELTAQWIEGTIAEQPGYCDPSDLDDPERLVPLLAALNRSGYMTIQSQAAFDGPGYDGAHWQQRAAVMGFATWEMTGLIYDAANAARLHVIAHDPSTLPRWFTCGRVAVGVTQRGSYTVTGFGSHLSRRFLRGDYGDCHRGAVDALCAAWQVTVIDPEWGRLDLLWKALEPAARRSS